MEVDEIKHEEKADSKIKATDIENVKGEFWDKIKTFSIGEVGFLPF